MERGSMHISFNTYKPYTSNYNINNKPANLNSHKQNSGVNFTSGYGAEEFDLIDNPDLTPRSNGERWRNIASAIKGLTIDAYREAHGYPKKPEPLFTPEEFKQYRDSFYEGTDAEDVDNTKDLVPGNPYDKFIKDDDFSPLDDVFSY